MFGYHRIAVSVLQVHLGNPTENVKEILNLIQLANEQETEILVFPELSLTGYSCGDLLGQQILLEKVIQGIVEIVEKTKHYPMLFAIGFPLQVANQLFNCAALIGHGKIYGVIPKTYLPNYREFYEKRWFSSARQASVKSVSIGSYTNIPFGSDLLFKRDENFVIGIEICEDLWAPISPSSQMAINGATVILNLSASNECIGKADYRKNLVLQHSAKLLSAYAYASAGVGESTGDTVFGGDALIVENGSIIAESARFQTHSSIMVGDIDVEKLSILRQTESSFADSLKSDCREINLPPLRSISSLQRSFNPQPFVPQNQHERNRRCEEILNIQAHGLAHRMKHSHVQKLVLGVSGGLDSTLALLVSLKTLEILNLPKSHLLALTMPGFGTGERTFKNVLELTQLTGVECRKIDITAACLQHFKDIQQDPNNHSTTYENTQARERTQILMDIANRENGLVVGTGDLSEIALGWSTYNGDHMSMYAVNAGIPKTLIRHIIDWVASQSPSLQKVLQDILETPVSPELLPSNSDNTFSQKTEDLIGPYELHDFFLYYVVRFGFSPQKILFLASLAFANKYQFNFIKQTLVTFYKRFFIHQFKRSCSPDGPKIGTVSLSPRADWRMPSDAVMNLWIEELQKDDLNDSSEHREFHE